MFKVVDLCSGIGGIRKGFELTGQFQNVLSAEIDKSACKVYKHLFNDDAYKDLTSTEFKETVATTTYDVLLAGFPCQTFSRAGKKAGFNDTEKGTIFSHISEIIKETRPKCVFLENVDHLVTHDNGETFRTILSVLIDDFDYHVISAAKDEYGHILFNPKDFIRNSKNFGVPQNRPRTYIVAFNRKMYGDEVSKLISPLPMQGDISLYDSLSDLLEQEVSAKYFLSSGYLATLERHAVRERNKGNGFGYKIVNREDIEKPIANTLLATGGSGKERNLILDSKNGPKYANTLVAGKQSAINNKNIRMMTPDEWGKLQGFVNYAFLDNNGSDHFSFPEDIADSVKYRLFGNAVTIPTIKVMADFILQCFTLLGENVHKD